MNDEMRTEAMELCVTACEKFSTNNEVCIIIHKIVREVRLTLSELKKNNSSYLIGHGVFWNFYFTFDTSSLL